MYDLLQIQWRALKVYMPQAQNYLNKARTIEHKPQYDLETLVHDKVWKYVSFSKRDWGKEISCSLQGSV